MSLLRDDVLAPIPGDSPGGVSLRYDPLFIRIAEARREEDDLPDGTGASAPRKLADPALVARLAGEALATRSKDLWLGAWLTEALLKRAGFGGLAEGLAVLRNLLAQFWDTLHPALDEDGDAELRLPPLEWIASTRYPPDANGPMVLAVWAVPLTAAGHGYRRFAESREVGYEAAAEGDEERARRRLVKIADGKLPAEEWDRAVDATDTAAYQSLAADIDAALDMLAALAAASRERFGDAAPSYGPLRETLEEVRGVVRSILDRRDVPEASVAGTEEGGALLAGADGGHGHGIGVGRATGAASNGSASTASTTRGRRQAGDGPSLLDQAVAEVHAGNAARGVELLMSAAGRGRSRRERFIRRTTAARVMVDAGLHAVAIPLLEQLVADVDAFKLEEWESGDVVAAPMALLWRCYDRTGRDAAREPLYLRVCRLDPVQAIALGPAAGRAS